MPLSLLVSLDRQLLPALAKLHHVRCGLVPIRSSQIWLLRQSARWQSNAIAPAASSDGTRMARYDPDASVADEEQGGSQVIRTSGSGNGRALLKPDLNHLVVEALRQAGERHAVPLKKQYHGVHALAKRLSLDVHRVEASSTAGLRLTLQSILASYIRFTAEKADLDPGSKGLVFDLTRTESELLDSTGYSLADVKHWAHILTERDNVLSAKLYVRSFNDVALRRAPQLVLMLLLRRPYIGADALRAILNELLSQLKVVSAHETQLRALGLSNSGTSFAVVSALLRHARAVWPQALEAIACLFTTLARGVSWPMVHERKFAERLNRRTSRLNRILHLLSLPTLLNPLAENMYRERAQIHVLKFMAEHRPQLDINKEGYRAVVRVQIAQKKTNSEREWASLKALSWPPWKEDRTGMDASFGPEDGISRAGRTLQIIREAGYRKREWEDATELYAGWDTDRSPAIQYRTNVTYKGSSVADVWAARVRATRTVQEAWACFLTYDDSLRQPDQAVYLAMFEKLVFESKRLSRKVAQRPYNDVRHGLLPGDSKEVSPPPPSSHLETYTQSPPPTVQDLFQRMLSRNSPPLGRCLNFLVATASSIQAGISYIRSNEEVHPGIKGLMTLETRHDTSKLPDRLFAAFIELLCRFSHVNTSRWLHDPRGPAIFGTSTELNFRLALVRAILLLLDRKPMYRPPWISVLHALASPRSGTTIGSMLRQINGDSNMAPNDMDNHVNTMQAFQLSRRITETMQRRFVDLDAEAVRCLCIACENAARSAWRILSVVQYDDYRLSHHKAMSPDAIFVSARQALAGGSFLHDTFAALVGEDKIIRPALEAESYAMPRLLTVPHPALLHSYARALGWVQAYDKILELVRWMVRFEPELTVTRAEPRNGQALMRKTIIAVRVFLERSWISHDSAEGYDGHVAKPKIGMKPPDKERNIDDAAAEDVVTEARSLIDGVEVWGGWATDDEVETYCEDARFRDVKI